MIARNLKFDAKAHFTLNREHHYRGAPLVGAKQARRHVGAFWGCAPQITARVPQTRIVPPNRGLCLEEINRLAATGEQFEAWDFQNTGYHSRIREQEVFFRRFCDEHRLFLWLHPIIHQNSRIFWDEDLFFLVFTSDFMEIRSFFAMGTRMCGTLRILRWRPFFCL